MIGALGLKTMSSLNNRVQGVLEEDGAHYLEHAVKTRACVLLVTVAMLIVVDPLNKELEILHERSLVEFTSSLSLCRRRILPSPAPSYCESGG